VDLFVAGSQLLQLSEWSCQVISSWWESLTSRC